MDRALRRLVFDPTESRAWPQGWCVRFLLPERLAGRYAISQRTFQFTAMPPAVAFAGVTRRAFPCRLNETVKICHFAYTARAYSAQRARTRAREFHIELRGAIDAQRI